MSRRVHFFMEDEEKMWQFFVDKIRKRDVGALRFDSNIWVEYRNQRDACGNSCNHTIVTLNRHFQHYMLPKLGTAPITNDDVLEILQCCQLTRLKEDHESLRNLEIRLKCKFVFDALGYLHRIPNVHQNENSFNLGTSLHQKSLHLTEPNNENSTKQSNEQGTLSDINNFMQPVKKRKLSSETTTQLDSDRNCDIPNTPGPSIVQSSGEEQIHNNASQSANCIGNGISDIDRDLFTDDDDDEPNEAVDFPDTQQKDYENGSDVVSNFDLRLSTMSSQDYDSARHNLNGQPLSVELQSELDWYLKLCKINSTNSGITPTDVLALKEFLRLRIKLIIQKVLPASVLFDNIPTHVQDILTEVYFYFEYKVRIRNEKGDLH